MIVLYVLGYFIRNKQNSYAALIFFFTIHSSALKLGVYRSSMSASLLVLPVFMCDGKRGYGGHISFVFLFHMYENPAVLFFT